MVVVAGTVELEVGVCFSRKEVSFGFGVKERRAVCRTDREGQCHCHKSSHDGHFLEEIHFCCNTNA